MEKIFLFLLILNPIISFGQIEEFAMVNDKDGFANVRYRPNLKSKIVGRLKDKEVFFAMSEVGENDWIEIGKPNLQGFIHKSRVILFSSFPEIKVSPENENYVKFHNKAITLEISSEKFNSKTNSIQKSSNVKVIEKINGKKFYGTDGDLPKTSFKSIVCKIDNKKLPVGREQLNDIFEPNLSNAEAYFDAKTETIYFSMYNSDGAGGYYLGFIFHKNEKPQRYIFNEF